MSRKASTMDIERVAIVGKGALGIMYADAIAQALGPNAVAFAMDAARYERHAGETVLVNGVERAFACVRPEDVREPFDLVIFATKAGGLGAALDLAACLVGPNTRLVSVLNGIRSEGRIAARFGWQNLVLCVAQGMDAVRLDGELTYSKRGQLRFGAAEAAAPGVVDDLAAFFKRVGLAYVVEEDPRHRLWAKFMLNVGVNQTCMVYGGTYGSVTEPGSEQNRTFVAAMREVMAVAQAEGIGLTEADLSELAALMATLDPAGMPSMAQDRLAKRPSEVEEFAGAVIAHAERHGILVPTNRWLYQRVREIEAAY